MHQRYYEPYGAIEGEDLGNGLTQGAAGAGYTYLHYRDYTPWGAPADMGLGNGVYQSWTPDARMRVATVAAYLPGSDWSNWFLDVDFGYNPDSTMASLTDELGSWNQDLLFSYDPLNRLSSWSNKNGFSCGFNLDRFGNLTGAGGNPSCGMLTGKQINAQNQIAGMVYDASGQPLSDSAGSSYSWNVEGLLSGFQQTGQPAYGYLYDGLGRQAEKLVNGVVTAVYLRDAEGQLVSEMDGAQFTDNILSPGDGARIASVVGPGVNTIYYYHADPLGTPRAITTAAGANLMNCAQHAGQPNGSMLTYSPFGAAVGGCDQSAQPYNFTGKYRDDESTLDDFGARYYQSSLARFLSPDWSSDPEPVPYAEPGDPQSLNLYTYARNNPWGGPDPDGHFVDGPNCGYPCEVTGQPFLIPGLRTLSTADAGARSLLNLFDFVKTQRAKLGGFIQDHPAAATIAAIGLAFLTHDDEEPGAARIGPAGEGEAFGVVYRALRATGNESISVSSRAIGEQAAEEFLGPGSVPFKQNYGDRLGQVVGRRSADGLRQVREDAGHFNFENKATGGNLHVKFGSR
ncbi:MAG TPA: RHS repeat-associated core domain-containing protein [Terriglobales bacterium]